MVEQQFQKSHSTNAPPYQTKYATDNEKTTKTNVSNPMSKQILKNTPSQSRERPLSLQLPPAAIGYHVAKRNPAATITLRHTTKCSTSDYTSCRRIISKTTHHNLPHYNIVGRGHAHSLPPPITLAEKILTAVPLLITLSAEALTAILHLIILSTEAKPIASRLVKLSEKILTAIPHIITLPAEALTATLHLIILSTEAKPIASHLVTLPEKAATAIPDLITLSAEATPPSSS